MINTKCRSNRKLNTLGYTLAEMLVTVLILVILLGVTIPFLIKLQRSLRQTELDSKAEIIYTAAQNRLSKLRAAGNLKSYKPLSGTGTTNIIGIPADAPDEDELQDGDIYYFTSLGKGSVAENILNEDTIDAELLNNHWVVEYNPGSATVYAVFYSESAADCASEYISDYSKYDTYLRWKENRLSDGARVGYYGGGSASSGNVTDLNPKLVITNAEKLVADISCTLPSSVPLGQKLVFKVEIADSFNNTYTKYYTSGAGQITDNPNNYEVDTVSMNVVGRKHTLRLILDDLSSSSKRFDCLYGEGSNHDHDGYGNGKNKLLVPGADITVTVSVSCPDNYKLTQNATVSSKTNSLFYYEEGVTEFSSSNTSNIAYINCGRHLQNLDISSGILAGIPSQNQKAGIACAVQTSDIIFAEAETLEGLWDWEETYGSGYFNGMCAETGTPSFKPIRNTELISFNGAHVVDGEDTYFRITGLTESAESGNVNGIVGLGLFEQIGQTSVSVNNNGTGILLKDITLTGTKLYASGSGLSAGAIAGSVNGIVTIDNCQEFLTESDVKGTSNANVWISGDNAGGLVGVTESGASLTIKNSGASTVIGAYTSSTTGNDRTVTPGNTNAGGLVGSAQAGSKVTIQNSYADSYLVGMYAGGLIASSDGFAEINSSYSAGFVTASKMAAGLVLGEADVSNSYTIISELDMGDGASYYRLCKSGTASGIVYYSVGNTLGVTDQMTPESKLQKVGDLSSGSLTIEKMTENMNNGSEDAAFTIDTSSSRPYNLMSQGLTTYTYPALAAVCHYGDWSADFQVGALVYYEKYLPAAAFDSSGNISSGAEPVYGFYGANVESTLKDEASYIVVGDGYGVVYGRDDENLPDNIEVTLTDRADSSWTGEKATIPVRLAHSTTSSANTFYSVTTDKGDVYDIYPFSNDLVNTVHASSIYYLKAEIKASAGSAEYYYFNPHFASSQNTNNIVFLADSQAAPPALTSDSNIAVRTPRHLYDMSLYYPAYAGATASSCYLQERNIDYREYQWSDFTLRSDNCRSQSPIGIDASGNCTAFTSGYEGNYKWITNVSFITENGNYAGFIADNGGYIRNVVLKSVYTPDSSDNYYVQRSGDVRDMTVSMGVLAGNNSGKISNCAASGYYLAGSDGTIHAYTNSTLNIGGMVGSNTGSIEYCSADTPRIRLSATYAKVSLGGFIGSNRGSINDSYDLGYLEVADSRGGNVDVGGFAGLNSGIIQNSYCATAQTISGENAHSYGFAPLGGSVSSCDYLNKGSYSYIGKLHSFNFTAKESSADERSYHYLVKVGDYKKASFSYNFNNTQASSDSYPFRAVVRDEEYHLVHYGDWLDDEKLGDVGVFYWEREEGGSNNGIHFTYLGASSKGSFSGTSLCNAHDDGGIITEYGYGYFERNVGSIVKIDVSGMNYSGPQNGNVSELISSGSRGEYVEVSNAIREQINESSDNKDYYFYAYRTRKSSDTDQNDENDKDYLCLSATDKSGTWELTYQDNNGEGEKSYKFEISPFFANSMRVMSGIDAEIKIKSEDGLETDYKSTPGTEDNKYEIRSIQQLQYINWNNDAGNTNTLINSDGSNKAKYTYLAYTSVSGTGTQTKGNAGNSDTCYWLQSHDLNAKNVKNYVPIAGQSRASDNSNYNAMLYTWFGGSYDGQNYKISELSFDSPSVTVGLFGVTAGATINNVIMYSENKATIRRSTTNTDTLSSYAIGGLIGVAYDYASSTGNTVTNCAIAGYRIIDDSKNQQGRGEACVGGLIGVANVGVEKSSSVVDIEINCTHYNSSGSFTTASWGNYVRVGGITGAAQRTINNCYSGGTVKVGQDTLEENNNSSLTKVGVNTSGTVDHQKSTNIYIAGISGSGFAMNYQNFTGNSSLKEGSPDIENCYTYMKMPAYEGSIRSITLIGSVADRYAQDVKATIKNCYYLDSSAEIDTNNAPKFSISGGGSVANLISNKTYLQDMLNGNSKFVGKMLGNAEQNKLSGAPVSKSYDELKGISGDLGSDWSSVTTTEGSGNIRIDGKYSFPAGNKALEGKNYPFPTIVTQRDINYDRKVHVHYGEWTINGPYWEEGRAQMDIFKDMKTSGNNKGFAEKVFYLNLNKTNVSSPTDLSSYEVSSSTPIAEITKVEKVTDSDGTEKYAVTLKALRTGTATISLKGTEASFTLEVTSDIALISSPVSMKIASGATDNLTMYAVTDKDQTVTKIENLSENIINYESSDNANWTITPSIEDVLSIKAASSAKNKFAVQRTASGETILDVQFTYHYGHDVNATGSGAHDTDIVLHKFVSVLQPDTIGISDGKSQYNAAEIQSEATKTITAVSTSYSSDPPSTSDADFFIYMQSTDTSASLDSVQIEEIQINDMVAAKNEDGSYEVKIGGDTFRAEISATTVKDSKYQYLKGKLFRVSNGTSQESISNVKLTVTVVYNSVNYVLPLTLSQIDTRSMLTVTYKDDNPENVDYTVNVWSGEYKLLAAIPSGWTSASGKMITGWKDINNVEHTAGDTLTITGDTSFTAVWGNLKVKLNANTGMFSAASKPDNVTLSSDNTEATVVLTPDADSKFKPFAFAPEKSGYSLGLADGTKAWIPASGTVSFAGDSTLGEDEILQSGAEFTANWFVNVKLDPNGGKCVNEDDTDASDSYVTMNYGSNEVLTSNGEKSYKKIVREGYRFLGWATDKNDSQKIVLSLDETDSETKFSLTKLFNDYTDSSGRWIHESNDNVILYSQWIKVMKFDGNSPTGYESDVIGLTDTMKSGIKFNELNTVSVPYCKGYVFSGWSTSKDNKQNLINLGTITSSDFAKSEYNTLYAQWTRKVIFDGNAPTNTATVSNVPDEIDFDQLSTVTQTPECSNFKFAGWSTSQYGDVKSLNAIVDDDLTWDENGTATLYARWYGKIWKQSDSLESGKSYAIGVNGYLLSTDLNNAISVNKIQTITDSSNYLWTISKSGNGYVIKLDDSHYLKHVSPDYWSTYQISIGSYESQNSIWNFDETNNYFSFTTSFSRNKYYLTYLNGFSLTKDNRNDVVTFYSYNYDETTLQPSAALTTLSLSSLRLFSVASLFEPTLILNDRGTDVWEGTLTGLMDNNPEYSMPEQGDGNWTLEGWYSSTGSDAVKVLNADGSPVSGFELSEDTTLYAGWRRNLDVFERVTEDEELEDGGCYLLIDQETAENADSDDHIAIGCVSDSSDVLYRQNVEVYDSDEARDVVVNINDDSDMNDSSFIINVPEVLVWKYSEKEGDGNETIFVNEYKDASLTVKEISDQGLILYKKLDETVPEKKLTFNNTVRLILAGSATDGWNTGTEYDLQIDENGKFLNWPDQYSKPEERLNEEFHGWFIQENCKGAKVLSEDGTYFDDNISWTDGDGETVSCIENGKWVYEGNSLVLFEGWMQKSEIVKTSGVLMLTAPLNISVQSTTIESVTSESANTEITAATSTSSENSESESDQLPEEQVLDNNDPQELNMQTNPEKSENAEAPGDSTGDPDETNATSPDENENAFAAIESANEVPEEPQTVEEADNYPE